MPATVRWIVLALLGLLIAASVSIAASSLVSQQIGLDSEPISAGDALAPQAPSPAHRQDGARHKPPAKTPPAPAPTEPTIPPPASTESQPPPTVPAAPAPPSGSTPSGGEQDHGGEAPGHADD